MNAKTTVSRCSPCSSSRKAICAKVPVTRPSITARRNVANVTVLKAKSARSVVAAVTRSTQTISAKSSDGKKTVLITGTSSGLGLKAAAALAATGEWHIIAANRNMSKTLVRISGTLRNLLHVSFMVAISCNVDDLRRLVELSSELCLAAELPSIMQREKRVIDDIAHSRVCVQLAHQQNGIDRDNYTYIQCDLASLESVRKCVDEFRATGRTLDCLVCNAAVYWPTATEPTFTVEGYEESVGVNHLAHFLLATMLLEDLKKSEHKRMIIVGSITGNKNTLAGMIPPQADLGQLAGMSAGFKYPNVMIDGGEFVGAKAYKDAKVCNMLTMREFDRRYAKDTGIVFSSLYPGCIAETALFRNHVKAFRYLFPAFQKNITQGYVSEEEAGKRLARVVADPEYNQSGAYWSWSNDSEAFVNTPSDEVQDLEKGKKLWQLSEKLVGFESPAPAAAEREAVPA